MFVVQNERSKRAKVPKKTIDKKFKSDFSVLYETKIGSDVILVAGNQVFNAHKAILMARSDVFAAMFDNQMREKIENKVEIKDIEPEVLDVMLLYLYTGDVKDMDKIGAPLMTAADKYGLDELKAICRPYVITNICTDTAIETLILSQLMNDSNLKRSALEFIRDNLRDVIKTKDWTNLQAKDSKLLDEIVLFSSHCNHSIEAKINWNLTQISQLNKNYRKSPITKVHGLPWRIMAFNRKKPIEGTNGSVNYFGVFLCCDHQMSSTFSCNARAELILVSQREGIPNLVRKLEKTFCKGLYDWGYVTFKDWSQLLDPNNGFIKDDTIVLEANIIVDPPKGVTDSEADSDQTENEEISSDE